MNTSTSSSELHQGHGKTKMPTSSFTGLARGSSSSFRPTTPPSTRSSLGAQSSINTGMSSELRFKSRAARSDVSTPLTLHSEIPSLAGKENPDSGMAPFLFSDRLRDSDHTGSHIVDSSSDMAPISWKDYIPEMNLEPNRINSGNATNLKNQSKSFYGNGIPRTNSTQSFGSIFNLHESIPKKTQEGSKHGKQSQMVDVQNQNDDSLFTFSNYINDKDQYGNYHVRSQENSTPSLGAQPLVSSLNFQEFISEVTQDASNIKLGGRAKLGTTGTGGNSLSLGNHRNFANQIGELHETPVTSSIQSLGTQSLGSGFSFEEYLPKTILESNGGKLGKQSDKASGKFPKNSTEKLDVQSLGLDFNIEEYLPEITQDLNKIHLGQHQEIPNVEPKSASEAKFEAFKDSKSFGHKFNGKAPTNLTQNLHRESIPERKQELRSFKMGEQFGDVDVHRQNKDNHITFSSTSEGKQTKFSSTSEGKQTKFTPYDKGQFSNSINSIGSNFQSPLGGFTFTSKFGPSEGPKKEIKGPRRKYIKINKKSGRKLSGMKMGDSKEDVKFNFEEGSTFKPETVRGESNYSNVSSDNNPFLSTMGDAKLNGTNFSFSEATYLDPILLKRNSETTPLYSSITGISADGTNSFSRSKSPEKMTVSMADPHYGKKIMSNIGHSSFITRSVPVQLDGPELHRSLSFPSKPHSGLRSEQVHEFPNIGEYGTSRSSTDNDGEKWNARGNEVYQKGDMKSAEEFYTRGIKSMASGETYQSRNRSLVFCYSNRAAVRMSLGQVKEALGDCLTASKIDPTFPKVQLQIANCLVALGDLEEAIKQFNKCLESKNYEKLDSAILSEASSGLNKAHKVLEYISLAEDIMKLDSDQVPKALDLISDALSISSHSDRLMEMKVNALLKMRRYEDAIQYCQQIPDSDGKDYIRKQWRLTIIAKSYFYLGKLDDALEVIKRNEQAAVDSEWYESDSSSSQTEDIGQYENKFPEPDTSFIVTLRELARLKAAGNEAFHVGQYSEAVEHYSAAIACSTESWILTAVCLCNRAAAYQALGQIIDAITDCSLAIALDPANTKAFSRRASLYTMIRDYRQAVNDLRVLISLLEKQEQDNQAGKTNRTNISDDLNRARRRLLSAEELDGKGFPLNPYLILGVEESASVDNVKEAYEKAAVKHHPDEVLQSLPKKKKADGDAMWTEVAGRVHKDADHLFKIIGEAYAVLSDTTKRAKYDLDEEKWNTKKTHNAALGTPRKSAPRW